MTDANQRGRSAKRPRQIPFRGWKDIAWRLKNELADDHVGLIAAGVAFYALLALFPMITALVAIGGLMLEPSQIVSQLDFLSGLLPQEVSQIIIDQAKDVAGSDEGGLGLTAIFGLGLALYSASKGVASLIEGLNVAYDETEKRGMFRLQLLKFGLTLLFVLGFLFALFAYLAIPTALALLNLGAATEMLISGFSLAMLLGLSLVGLAVIYRFGPSRRNAQWSWVSPGALVAGVGWLVASAGFAFYVSNFGSYNESFGALSGVIVMLTWLWISAFIVLLGAEINGEIEAQTRHDTTVGAEKPMGKRGATKADILGEAWD